LLTFHFHSVLLIFVNLWPISTLCVADMVHLWPIWFVADIVRFRAPSAFKNSETLGGDGRPFLKFL